MIYIRFALIFLWFASSCLNAEIGVSPIIVDLAGKDADAEISVKNFDTKHNAYVEITPYRLLNPSDHEAPKTRVTHPKKDGLLIFPSKLVLLPGQTQFVRVVKTIDSLAADRVYEIDFIPKVSTHLKVNKIHDNPLMGIRVVVGYGARVTLRPDVPMPKYSMTRNKNTLVIKNTGNTSLALTSCTQQNSGKKKEIALPAYTLFVGQTIKKELDNPTQVTLNAAFMGKSLGSSRTN